MSWRPSWLLTRQHARLCCVMAAGKRRRSVSGELTLISYLLLPTCARRHMTIVGLWQPGECSFEDACLQQILVAHALRCSNMRPPPALAPQLAEQQEAVRKLAAVLGAGGGGGRSSRTPVSSTAAASADAVAAAERAMQELLVGLSLDPVRPSCAAQVRSCGLVASEAPGRVSCTSSDRSSSSEMCCGSARRSRAVRRAATTAECSAGSPAATRPASSAFHHTPGRARQSPSMYSSSNARLSSTKVCQVPH
jgi:hypothetical protein